MNKYEEAFTAMATFVNLQGCIDSRKVYVLKQIETISELVHKATPMKIIVSDKEKLFCPNCMTNYRIMTFSGECAPNFENPFCGECGQALDWSDERW